MEILKHQVPIAVSDIVFIFRYDGVFDMMKYDSIVTTASLHESVLKINRCQ